MIYSCNDLRGAVRKKHRTYVVIGNPRGGTSMIAGLLAMAGVTMGAESGNKFFEDVGFLDAREPINVILEEENPARRQMLGRLVELVEKRNDRFKIWGWKDPLAMYYADLLVPILRNPIFVFIWRDPLAIALREKKEIGLEEKSGIHMALDRNVRMDHLLRHVPVPMLHCSFEKAKENKALFVKEFCGRLNFPVTENLQRKMVGFMRPGYQTTIQ
jgi:hypothetical protein